MRTIIRNFKAIPLIPVVMALFSTPVFATLAPPPDLHTLVSSADLIVVGEVTSLLPLRSAALEGQAVASLRIDRVLKGESNTDIVRFRVPDTQAPMAYGEVVPFEFGMFFLRSNDSNVFELADPYYPFLRAARSASVASSHTARDRVADEMGCLLGVSATSLPDRVAAIDALESLNTDAARGLLRREFEKPGSSVRFEAAAALLRGGDVGTLRSIYRILLSSTTSAQDQLYSHLTLAIQEGIRDPKAVPILSQLARASDPRVRRATAWAMAKIGAPSVVEPLSSLLHDSDYDVRYGAVVGLANAEHEPAWWPSLDEFRANEGKYVSHWIGVNKTCVTDVSSHFAVNATASRVDPATGRFRQEITLTKISGTPLPLPITIVLDGLRNAALFNKDGLTACAANAGDPYITIDATAGLTATFEFTRESAAPIEYDVRVFSGPGVR